MSCGPRWRAAAPPAGGTLVSGAEPRGGSAPAEHRPRGAVSTATAEPPPALEDVRRGSALRGGLRFPLPAPESFPLLGGQGRPGPTPQMVGGGNPAARGASLGVAGSDERRVGGRERTGGVRAGAVTAPSGLPL